VDCQCNWEEELSENVDDFSSVVTVVGCLNDVRLNGLWLPMDRSQNEESEAAVFSPRSQNIDDECESNACVGILCAPGLVCVDVWRHADCRLAFLFLTNIHIPVPCTHNYFNGLLPGLHGLAKVEVTYTLRDCSVIRGFGVDFYWLDTLSDAKLEASRSLH